MAEHGGSCPGQRTFGNPDFNRAPGRSIRREHGPSGELAADRGESRGVRSPPGRTCDLVVIERFRTVHAPAPQWIWSRGGPIVRSREAALRREDSIVFVIRLLDGEEVHAAEGDKLTINEQTGVLSVLRVDGFEEVTTHYSPSAWATVTHRIKEHVVRPSLVGTKK
jgi:hypothetical protein